MWRTSGRSLGTLLRFDTHFNPEICTCSPSLFSRLPLSPTPLPVLTPLYILSPSPKDLILYTFAPKCTLCSYTVCLELKLSSDVSKTAKYMGSKIVPSFDVLSIYNVTHVNMLEVVQVTGKNKRCRQLTAGENSLYSTCSIWTLPGKVRTYLQYSGS